MDSARFQISNRTNSTRNIFFVTSYDYSTIRTGNLLVPSNKYAESRSSKIEFSIQEEIHEKYCISVLSVVYSNY